MTRPVVLFSSGLDSAVLLLQAAQRYGSAQPVYIRSGLAWEEHEQATAERFLARLPSTAGVRDLVVLDLDMRDVYPPTHWAVRGEAPAFDTPDEDVYLEGRNLVLLSKTAVFAARTASTLIVIGPLAGNPFPDARPEFFDAMARALSLGLDTHDRHRSAVPGTPQVRRHQVGMELGVPFELTLSCMQPVPGSPGRPALHCGRCSKCRERRDAFADAGLTGPGVAHAH